MKKRKDNISHWVVTYRQCFGTNAGRKVLANLLHHAGYFDIDMKTVEELAVLNFVKVIIKNLGITNTEESFDEFVNKLFEMKGL